MQFTATNTRCARVLGLAIWAAAAAFPAYGQLVVSNLEDSGPGSLRAAVSQALDGQTITFDAAVLGQTLELTGGAIRVLTDVTIVGDPGARFTIDAQGDSRIFELADGVEFGLSGVDLVNGFDTKGGAVYGEEADVRMADVKMEGNQANGSVDGDGGGAVYLGSGGMEADRVEFVGNKATGDMGRGGAVFVKGDAKVDIADSDFTDNEAKASGGAVEDQTDASKESQYQDTDFAGNKADAGVGAGGAICLAGGGKATVDGGTFDGNEAGSGGAIVTVDTDLDLKDAELKNNTAKADAGGGAVYNDGGTVQAFGTTAMTDNDADAANGKGGALVNDGGGKFQLYATKLERNSAQDAGGAVYDKSDGTEESGYYGVEFAGNTVERADGKGGAVALEADVRAVMSDGRMSANRSMGSGGAVYSRAAKLRVLGTEIDGNLAMGNTLGQGGGGIYNEGDLEVKNGAEVKQNRAAGTNGCGGGVLNGPGGRVEVAFSKLDGNYAEMAGGALEEAGGGRETSVLYATDVTANETGDNVGRGGGIHLATGGKLDVYLGRIGDNRARYDGGGLYNEAGKLRLDGVEICDNEAAGDDVANGGGGVYNRGGDVLMVNRTRLLRNAASGLDGCGGGLINDASGKVDAYYIEIDGNVAAYAGGGVEEKSGLDGRMNLYGADIRNNRAEGSRRPARNTSASGFGGGIHVATGSKATAKESDISGNEAGAKGGGVYNEKGEVELDKTQVNGNDAKGDAETDGGGGIYNDAGVVEVKNDSEVMDNDASGVKGSGGGVFNGVGGTITLADVTVEGNVAKGAGGGIEECGGVDGQLTLERVKLQYNAALDADRGDGGGLHVEGAGKVDIVDSDLTGNTAARRGGGVFNDDAAVLTLVRSNVMDNTASGAEGTDGGGGVFNNRGDVELRNSAIARNRVDGAAGIGGGVYNYKGTMRMRQSTVGENASAYDFGGIANDGDADIISSTIARNSSARRGGGVGMSLESIELRIKGSIIAQNLSAGPGNGQDFDLGGGLLTSGGYNIVGDDDGLVFIGNVDDQIGSGGVIVDPILDTLAYRPGRRTPTYKLLCGSPARDMGDPADFEADQDGTAIFNGRRDIGAYEADDLCATPLDGPRVDRTAEAAYRVYPNPSNGEPVRVELTAGNPADRRTVELVDASGRVVRSAVFVGESTFLPVGDREGGAYQLRIQGETQPVPDLLPLQIER